MLTVLALVGALAVLFVAAAVSTREGDVLRDAPRDAADLDLPAGPLQPEDVADVRLGLALRGYRMDEVDHLLERVVADLVARDGRVGELEAALAAVTDRQLRATELPGATPDVTSADLDVARRRSLEAAAELETQAAVAPPLAGRGRFVGVRVRTAEGERLDRRPADTGTADRGKADTGTAGSGTADRETADTGTADRETADRGAAGSERADSGTPDIGTSDRPVAGERAVPGEEHHSAPDRVGGDSSRP